MLTEIVKEDKFRLSLLEDKPHDVALVAEEVVQIVWGKKKSCEAAHSLIVATQAEESEQNRWYPDSKDCQV